MIQKVRIQDGFVLREYAGEFCVFESAHVNDGAVDGIPSFNSDGVFLWNLLESGVHDLSALAGLLAERNQLPVDDTEIDVQEFLARLLNAGIIIAD